MIGIPLSVAAVFLVAAASPLIVSRTGRWAGWLLAAAPATLFAWFASRAGEIADGRLWFAVDWVPSLGVRLAFALDGLSLTFVLLISGIGALVVVFAGDYMADDSDLGRFFGLLFAFMGAMLGLVLADDLITLFVFWELTSLCSYLLIGYKHEAAKARAAALQALLITGGGGLALLVGFLILGGVADTYALSEILGMGATVKASAAYPAILLLVLLGAWTKSAQWPFHAWLPNAMAAPTPVSAYLHSATMVKAGIYLLARFDPVLGGTALWLWLVTPIGVITMLLGAVLALGQTDLKRVLAYSTLTALGTLVALLGLSFPEAVKAAVVFLIVHSLYKAGLFLVAGAMDHATGTRDIRELSGLRRLMPLTALAALLSGLSMAGLPPLFGFVAKELTYKAKLGFGGGEMLLPAVAVLANALTVTAAGIVAVRPFIGRSSDAATRARDGTPALLLGPLVLGAAGLALGLAPYLVGQRLVEPAISAVLGAPFEIELSLWYGWNTALALSVGTIALGLLVFLRRHSARRAIERAIEALPVTADSVYGGGLTLLTRTAAAQTRLLMRGGTSIHLFVILAVAGLLLWTALAPLTGLSAPPMPRADWVAWILAALVVLEAIGAVRARQQLAGAAALGALGFSVALLFLLAGAPDLATTQFLVETLIVLVLVLVLRRLPATPEPRPGAGRRAGAAAAALAVGGGFTALMLGVVAGPYDPALADFFANASVPDGKGRNIVNVILVDFRALDTLGEVAVLGVAALGVLVLVEGVRPLPADRAAWESPILDVVDRFLVPLLAGFAVFLLWRGHNEPGGGFIAGLVAAGAVALRVLASGPAAGRALLRFDPRVYVGAGLLLAVVSGLWGPLLGSDFMTGVWTEVPLPGGPLKLGTPLLFDVGVFSVVVGFSSAVLVKLEERHG